MLHLTYHRATRTPTINFENAKRTLQNICFTEKPKSVSVTYPVRN